MAYYKCGKIFATQNSNTSIETASGAIANFRTSLAMPVLGCIAEFSASQASGTPTPSTPIPIVGVDKVNVIRTGKNLVNVGTQEVTGTYKAIELDAPIPAGTYTLSAKISSTYSTVAARFRKADTSALVAVTLSPASPNRSSVSVTLPEPAYYIYLYSANGQSGYTATWEDVQLEIGSATDYEPYNGTTAIINLGGTYYGGEVDAVTGKIVKTKSEYVFTGSENWSYHSSGFFYFSILDMNIALKAITASNGIKIRFNASTASTILRVYVADNTDYIDSNTDMQTIMTNGVQAIYELIEPETEYAQNTAEMPTIVGDNQVFADSGNIAVKYRKLHSDN